MSGYQWHKWQTQMQHTLIVNLKFDNLLVCYKKINCAHSPFNFWPVKLKHWFNVGLLLWLWVFVGCMTEYTVFGEKKNGQSDKITFSKWWHFSILGYVPFGKPKIFFKVLLLICLIVCYTAEDRQLCWRNVILISHETSAYLNLLFFFLQMPFIVSVSRCTYIFYTLSYKIFFKTF